MKIYLSGPMSGLPDFNHPAFNRAAKVLRMLGHQVVNPAEKAINAEGLSETEVWQAFMRIDIKQLVDCEALVMLPGWAESKGATLERSIAQALSIEIVDFTHAVLNGMVPCAALGDLEDSNAYMTPAPDTKPAQLTNQMFIEWAERHDAKSALVDLRRAVEHPASLIEWAERFNIKGMLADLREVTLDAASLHLSPTETAEEQGETA